MLTDPCRGPLGGGSGLLCSGPRRIMLCMLAERPLPGDLERRIEALANAWAEDRDIAAVYLFGSRAARRGGPGSDVDLAVVLRDGLDPDARWRKRLGLIADGTRRLGTDAVDVVVLEDVPSVVGHRVLSRGRLLAESNPRRRAWVAEAVLRAYLDEAHLRRILDAGLSRRIAEGRFAR